MTVIKPCKEHLMTYEQIMTQLFEFSIPTYYKWKKHQKRKIFDLLMYAFTKDDLEQFLNTGKISKCENINRLPEILKLLTKYTTKDLRVFLAKSYSDNDVLSGTYLRLKKFSEYKKEDKFDVLTSIIYLLEDVRFEISENSRITQFQKILNDFNKSIGFDFNIDDISAIRQIMSRYEVYSTLYDLDKPAEK